MHIFDKLKKIKIKLLCADWTRNPTVISADWGFPIFVNCVEQIFWKEAYVCTLSALHHHVRLANHTPPPLCCFPGRRVLFELVLSRAMKHLFHRHRLRKLVDHLLVLYFHYHSAGMRSVKKFERSLSFLV